MLDLDEEIGAVVIGFDIKATYAKMAYALYHLQNIPDCLYIATNLDSTFPTPAGLLPGGGSVISMLTTAYGKDPVVMGKPTEVFFSLIQHAVHLDPMKTCMVGDRLNTGINILISQMKIFFSVTQIT